MRSMMICALALASLLPDKVTGGDVDIKNYVQYQSVRQRSYADAVDHFDKTKGLVIVWVGVPDSEETFQAWLDTKDMGYHVFLDTCGDLPKGVTVAGNYQGKFCQLNQLPYNKNVAISLTVCCHHKGK